MGYKLRSDIESWLIQVSLQFRDIPAGSLHITFGNNAMQPMVINGPLTHKEAMKEIKRRTKAINALLYKHQAQLDKLIIHQNKY